MKAPDYDELLASLATSLRVLENNQGELSGADIRIRSLLGIATSEARRARQEVARPLFGGARDVQECGASEAPQPTPFQGMPS